MFLTFQPVNLWKIRRKLKMWARKYSESQKHLELVIPTLHVIMKVSKLES